MKSFLAPLFIVILSAGCLPALRIPQSQLLDHTRVASIIEENHKKRQRVSGIYKARATGVKRFFGSADLTVAAQQPSSFYLSIPSFFGSPARVVTSDGKHNYVLDMAEGEPLHLVEPSTAHSFEKWIGFKIEPRDFVSALLGIVELKHTSIMDTSVGNRNRSYFITLKHQDGREYVVEFDAKNDDLVSLTLTLKGLVIYKVSYSDFRDSAVGRFAFQIDVLANGAEGKAELVLVGHDLKFDEVPFEIDTFQIEQP